MLRREKSKGIGVMVGGECEKKTCCILDRTNMTNEQNDGTEVIGRITFWCSKTKIVVETKILD